MVDSRKGERDGGNDLSLALRETMRIPGAHPHAGHDPRMVGMAEEPTANPLAMVLDRLHGRWLWCVLLGIVLAGGLAPAAYFLVKPTYVAAGLISVTRVIDPKVIETPETEAMTDFQGYVTEQAVQLRTDRVLSAAVRDVRLEPFAGRIQADQTGAIAGGLDVVPTKGTGLITVAVESDDPQFAAAAVNAVMYAYKRIVAPNSEQILDDKTTAARDELRKVRGLIDAANTERLELLKNSVGGTANVQGLVDERVRQLEAKRGEAGEIEATKAKIRESLTLAAGEEPPADAAIAPTALDLERINPQLPAVRRELEATKTQLELAGKSYSPEHPIYKNVVKKITLLQAQLESEDRNARTAWAEGPAKSLRYGELSRRAEAVQKEMTRLKNEIDDLNLTAANDGRIQRQLAQLAEDERTFTERLKQLDTEADSIKKGRIKIEADAEVPSAPAKDRRKALAGAGAFGGFALSFALFFLWGSVDKRAFGTSQLVNASQGKLLLAGAIPDMKELEGDTDSKDLASNCVHRVRTRIESRRTAGDGYALMVSSPFQGDGKTTLAVALAWSYAESGYRTLLVDCDFIGQALSFQFGQLGAAGVREALQGEEPCQFVASAGAANLSILPVGRDRHFGASRVHPTGLRRLFRELRNRYDIIIVDTGPMTASIEALPVASSVDGVVLSLRRGRSRDRLDECIGDINSVGAEYLGVVLNYAERKDCLRYGSVSRMSVEISRALEGRREAPPHHPLLSAIQSAPSAAPGSQSAPNDRKENGASGDAA
jgi:succinoglycan biosynthesis transport protein ExoP